MSLIWEIITNHKHYWGVPHVEDKNEVVMVCYSCGKVKKIEADLCARC
jgi:hypothetical protein